MGFLNKVKTTLFGDLNDGQAHGVRAGFVPTLAPSLVAAGAIALGAPAAVVAGAAVALMAAKEAEKKGYNFKRLLTGGGGWLCSRGSACVQCCRGLPSSGTAQSSCGRARPVHA